MCFSLFAGSYSPRGGVQGGGMIFWVISLGGVQALEELGSYGSFQMFYGGAVSGL